MLFLQSYCLFAFCRIMCWCSIGLCLLKQDLKIAMMWNLYCGKGSGSARLTKTVHTTPQVLASLPYWRALLVGTVANSSYWELERDKTKRLRKQQINPRVVSGVPACFGPAARASRLSRSPAASGRYLCRSCGSFLRLTLVSVECGQAADTVLCQEFNRFPHPWTQDCGQEPSSLTRTSPKNTHQKMSVSFSDAIGPLRLTNIYRSFLPDEEQQQPRRWAGKSKEGRKRKTGAPISAGIGSVTDGPRADYRGLHASPSAHAENKQRLDFGGRKKTLLHAVGDLPVAQRQSVMLHCFLCWTEPLLLPVFFILTDWNCVTTLETNCLLLWCFFFF